MMGFSSLGFVMEGALVGEGACACIDIDSVGDALTPYAGRAVALVLVDLEKADAYMATGHAQPGTLARLEGVLRCGDDGAWTVCHEDGGEGACVARFLAPYAGREVRLALGDVAHMEGVV